jgi:hypothetical protein
MTNKWESRERNVKRIALIASVVLHLAAIVAITQTVGNGGISTLIEHVFGGDDAPVANEAKV